MTLWSARAPLGAGSWWTACRGQVASPRPWSRFLELAGSLWTLRGVRSAVLRDDADLWRAASIDAEAFGELFERHAQTVFAFCARRTGDLALAEDLTSVVFLEAWRKRCSVRLEDQSALPWLLGTAHNVVRNQHRALRRYRAALSRLSEGSVTPSGEEETIARLDAQRALSAALEAVNRLPLEQRDAVNLVLWSGLSYEDAARALGVPVGTVRSRIARARASLGTSLAAPTTNKELS
jgi:RNA polymerase sigma-70 factor, ECF subfamily